MRNSLCAALAASALLITPPPTSAQPAEEGTCRLQPAAVAGTLGGSKNLVETAVAAGSFKTLVAAVQAAGLVDALTGEGPLTVFAPSDEAFAALPAGTVAELLKPERRADLVALLTYHVVPGRVSSEAVTGLSAAPTLNGQRLSVRMDEGNVMIDGARVVKADIGCTNGVIHVIDRVLMPASRTIVETAVATKELSTLVSALQAAGLVEALGAEGPFTVFAPLDSAFAKLPEGTLKGLLAPEARERLGAVLKYHVVKGRVFADQLEDGAQLATLQGGRLEVRVKEGEVWVGGARVAKADVATRNGVVHVVDSVLLPR